MKRRAFIAGFCASGVWPLVSHAQQPSPIRLIGVLIGYAENDPAAMKSKLLLPRNRATPAAASS